MWRPGQVERCAFCGRTIDPGEESVGRGESAAHATCADAALGDDRLWEGVGFGAASEPDQGAVTDSGPGSGSGDSSFGGPPAAARGGCFAIAVGLLAVAALAGTLRAG